MGLYTDPNYFYNREKYRRRKIEKMIKAVSAKMKEFWIAPGAGGASR